MQDLAILMDAIRNLRVCLYIGLSEPIYLVNTIEQNPFNCVRLSSVAKLNRMGSDGLGSIKFDLFNWFGNRTQSTD